MTDPLAEWVLSFLRLRTSPTQHISRRGLAVACKIAGFGDVSDRQVRKAIEDLRRSHPDGGFILSSSRTGGYWMSSDQQEVELAIAEDVSRIEAARDKIAN